MQLAQQGFEAGVWTYHRTDSVHLSPTAVAMFRDRIAAKHPEVLPATPPVYASAEGAQEAHEALRITDFDVTPTRFVEAFGADASVGQQLWLMIAATFGLLLATLLLEPARQLFGFAPVSLLELSWCVLAALIGVGWIEGYKAIVRRGIA